MVGILAAVAEPRLAEIKQTAACVWMLLKHHSLMKQARRASGHEHTVLEINQVPVNPSRAVTEWRSRPTAG